MKNYKFLLVLPILAFSACAPSTSIQEQNKALVLRANEELLNKGNLDFADDMFISDYILHGSEGHGPELIKECYV